MSDPISAPGRIRAALLTPHLREVDPDHRGFYAWEEGPGIVEPVGRSFLQGFRLAMEQPGARGTMRALQQVPTSWRGFAAEGAAMAVCLRAAIEPWRRGEFHRLVSVSGGRHTYMMHVGLGWALARLPRGLWPRLSDLDPAVAGLVLDGYGFHEIFFHTTRTLERRDAPFPARHWPGQEHDAAAHVMQGIGRGLWFVAGGSIRVLGELIGTFPAHHSGSLWAGAGLAASYAGGRGRAALARLAEAAGQDARWVRQGCAFAVEARHRAGTVNDHTALAAETLCGRTIAELVRVTRQVAPTPHRCDSGDWSAYQAWREQVAHELRHAPEAVAGSTP